MRRRGNGRCTFLISPRLASALDDMFIPAWMVGTAAPAGVDSVKLVENVSKFKLSHQVKKGAKEEKIEIELNVTSLRLPTGFTPGDKKFMAITRPQELEHMLAFAPPKTERAVPTPKAKAKAAPKGNPATRHLRT